MRYSCGGLSGVVVPYTLLKHSSQSGGQGGAVSLRSSGTVVGSRCCWTNNKLNITDVLMIPSKTRTRSGHLRPKSDIFSLVFHPVRVAILNFLPNTPPPCPLVSPRLPRTVACLASPGEAQSPWLSHATTTIILAVFTAALTQPGSPGHCRPEHVPVVSPPGRGTPHIFHSHETDLCFGQKFARLFFVFK